MQKPLSRFLAAWLIGSIALVAAAVMYARGKNIPAWAAIPIAAAFLVEFPFYLVTGFETVRTRIDTALSRTSLALALAVSGLLPYLVYSLGTGQFHWRSFLELVAICSAASFWYVIFPRIAIADFAFLSLLAAVMLARLLQGIYTAPVPKLPLDILGHLMLIRLTIMVILLLRRVSGIGFGWIPSRREFLVGLQYFLYFLPFGLPLAWYLGLLRMRAHPNILWQAIAVGLGIFWVVALSEEFFFRGVLQQWIARWTGSSTAALLLASVCFGLVHLWFRAFPNWQMALVASVAGAFYGLAYREGQSIRASMVSHALVVTAWRVLLS